MCEYCEKYMNKKIQNIDNDNTSKCQIVKLNGLKGMENCLYIEINGKDKYGYKPTAFFKIVHCPMCGRKLGDDSNEK